ncbi:hypothetical protein D3C75_426920 [compost metagenome]
MRVLRGDEARGIIRSKRDESMHFSSIPFQFILMSGGHRVKQENPQSVTDSGPRF